MYYYYHYYYYYYNYYYAPTILQDFDVGEQLGKGGFATVYRARCFNTGKDVAIKKVRLIILLT